MKKILKVSICSLIFMVMVSATIVYAEDKGSDIEKYSLEKILRNYSIVSLGEKSKEGSGSVTLFHVNGQYLVNGELDGNGYLGPHGHIESFYSCQSKVDDEVTSCTSIESRYRVPNWLSWRDPYTTTLCSEIGLNFDNLYNNIVKQQKQIGKGIPIIDTGSVELKAGNYYTLKNVKDISEIKFDDFDKNKDKLTVITIEDEGTIKIPSTYYINGSGEKNKVITNDYIGGNTAYNEENGYVTDYPSYTYKDVYYGNIIWNIPNATKITFTGVPFPGHVIAPNADAEMPESNYSGAMIVKSLKAGGNSEGHFYPLTLAIKDLGTRDIKISLGCNCKEGTPDPRPDKVDIDIYANGKKIDTVTLTKENNWTYEYKGLSKTSDGETEIQYSLGGEYIEKNADKIDGFNIFTKCTVNPVTQNNVLILAVISILSVLVLLTAIVLNSKKKNSL